MTVQYSSMLHPDLCLDGSRNRCGFYVLTGGCDRDGDVLWLGSWGDREKEYCESAHFLNKRQLGWLDKMELPAVQSGTGLLHGIDPTERGVRSESNLVSEWELIHVSERHQSSVQTP